MNGEPPHSLDGDLLGIEIGRTKVRIVVLDWRANKVRDAIERPIEKAGGPRDPIEQEFSTRSAIEAGLDRLDVIDVTSMAAGATIGFPNCGVGSGPALREWLQSLSEDLDEPVLYTGSGGVSYVPASCIDFVRRVFEPTGIDLGRVELAPVAAARVLQSVRSGAISLGSGVAWSARLLNNQVLEAFETVDGGFDDELQVMINSIGQPITSLDGYEVDPSFGPNRGLTAAALAPSIGVAVALLDPEGPNLLEARSTEDHEELEPVQAEATHQPSHGAVEAAPDDEQDAEAWPPPDDDPVDSDTSANAEPNADTQPQAEDYDHFDQQVDDLGLIQDELRAFRTDGTYQLRRPPRTIEHSRELRSRSPAASDTWADSGRRSVSGPYGQVEDVARPTHSAPPSSDGFQLADFLLGALLMLAVVLAITLVIL